MEKREGMQARRAEIDLSLPVEERIARFVQAGGDPYRLTVNGMAVHLLFDERSPSLQRCLAALGKR